MKSKLENNAKLLQQMFLYRGIQNEGEKEGRSLHFVMV